MNPRQPAWKAGTLPLSYSRLFLSTRGQSRLDEMTLPPELLPLLSVCSSSFGSGQHASRRNYEQSGEGRIRTSEGIASRFTVCSIWPLWNLPARTAKNKQKKANRNFFLLFAPCYLPGATSRNRTRDPLITSEVLYQLSYGGSIKRQKY